MDPEEDEMKLTEGERVMIPCSIQPGAGRGEYLVTVESVSGQLSGFVKEEFIVRHGSSAFVLGAILGIAPDIVTMDIPGSFFTTAAGRTRVRSDWAHANLRPAGA
jgi:hypothetical protein